jgi:hypothetical protein
MFTGVRFVTVADVDTALVSKTVEVYVSVDVRSATTYVVEVAGVEFHNGIKKAKGESRTTITNMVVLKGIQQPHDVRCLKTT